jgi:hypothetical protein
MPKLELTGKVKHLHRVVLREKSPFVVQVEVDCTKPKRFPLSVTANGRPARSYELEFFVDDEEASRIQLNRPIRISLRQD